MAPPLPSSSLACEKSLLNFRALLIPLPVIYSPGNHSVTQSSFASPCEPLAGGFDSGWIEIPAGTTVTTPPTWSLTITNDQKVCCPSASLRPVFDVFSHQPIWFYCKQLKTAPHCTAGKLYRVRVMRGTEPFSPGMVGAINVQPGPNSLDAFQTAAKAATSVGVRALFDPRSHIRY